MIILTSFRTFSSDEVSVPNRKSSFTNFTVERDVEVEDSERHT